MTPKQERFVQEYLIDLNKTQAAIRAGYSEKMAYSIGEENTRKPEIAAAIQAAMDKRAQRTAVTADRVLAELAKVGFSNLSDVTDWGTKEVAFGFDADGKKLRPEEIGEAAVVTYADAPFVTPINRDDLPDDIKASVAEVSLGREGFKIKMHDKNAALITIARHLGMLKDKTELTGANGGPVELIRRLVVDPRG